MERTEILCDHCHSDLTTTGARPKNRLKLTCEHIPHMGGYRQAVHVVPPIKADHHFCNTHCLGMWFAIHFPEQARNALP